MNCTDKISINSEIHPHLCFIAQGCWISRFFSLLQKGIIVRARSGCSLTAFLREQAEAAPETIEKIQSIFLDGSPVDDLDRTIIKDGSILALSAAMPGLVRCNAQKERRRLIFPKYYFLSPDRHSVHFRRGLCPGKAL